jgi:predicted DCC family thiol-disulfide oxidoreductase YuxK
MSMSTPPEPAKGSQILLYDGVCGLCNSFIQFVLPRDKKGKFHFASLQSSFGTGLLARHDLAAQDLNSLYVIRSYGLPTENVLCKSDAVAFVLSELGGFWQAISFFALLPEPLRNLGYDLVAKNRYKIFGKTDICRLPDAATRDRFIEV